VSILPSASERAWRRRRHQATLRKAKLTHYWFSKSQHAYGLTA
jgi:hypothetical protein